MAADSYWKDFILVTFGAANSTISSAVGQQHQHGRVAKDNCLEHAEETIASLHKAARLEDIEEVSRIVQNLWKHPEIMEKDHTGQGFTPLHSAAMAIHPNAKIARLLIQLDSENEDQWLNQQTTDEKNTALHIAASNVNVTEEFIQQFKRANSLLPNGQKNTPYHVAAWSSNENTVINMLNTFAPTNNKWDVDDVDEGHKYDKVINICARNGNAKAVALLIKHGADISRGVLHEIVLESVRKAKKIEKLTAVYQSIVDNAVAWHCLEKNAEFLKFRGSDEYMALFQKIMIWLLTNPVSEKLYEGKNVLECALDHGACAMFRQIINTNSVFRRDGKSAAKWVRDDRKHFHGSMEMLEKEEKGAGKTRKKWYWTVFDVTNFTEETLLKSSGSDSSENSSAEGSTSPQAASVERTSLIDGNKHDADKLTILQRAHSRIDKIKQPDQPYLMCLLSAFDQWQNSNILCTQPLKQLTRPYIRLMQRIYGLLGVLQLIFMVLFTVYHMPTNCSLARMFNISNTHCTDDIGNNSIGETASIHFRQRSWTAVLWIIWPTFLIAVNVFTTFHYVKQTSLTSKQQDKNIVLKSRDLSFSLPGKIFETILQTVMSKIFCIMVFVWLYTYFYVKTYETYVEMTALVLLFGWNANLEFFGAVSKNFSIFSLVVKKIIVKDIPSFMLFFGFTVVGYSLAMHALRMQACNPNEVMDETFFSVLCSAFGIGDFFEVTMTTNSTCAEAGNQYLFELVYFGYVCETMIILLNVLIAMMNNRYEKSKPKTENIWRFQMLSIMRALQSHKCLLTMMKKSGILRAPAQNNKHNASLFFNKDLQRWYLRLVLPVDEQLGKLGEK